MDIDYMWVHIENTKENSNDTRCTMTLFILVCQVHNEAIYVCQCHKPKHSAHIWTLITLRTASEKEVDAMIYAFLIRNLEMYEYL